MSGRKNYNEEVGACIASAVQILQAQIAVNKGKKERKRERLLPKGMRRVLVASDEQIKKREKRTAALEEAKVDLGKLSGWITDTTQLDSIAGNIFHEDFSQWDGADPKKESTSSKQYKAAKQAFEKSLLELKDLTVNRLLPSDLENAATSAAANTVYQKELAAIEDIEKSFGTLLTAEDRRMLKLQKDTLEYNFNNRVAAIAKLAAAPAEAPTASGVAVVEPSFRDEKVEEAAFSQAPGPSPAGSAADRASVSDVTASSSPSSVDIGERKLDDRGRAPSSEFFPPPRKPPSPPPRQPSPRLESLLKPLKEMVSFLPRPAEVDLKIAFGHFSKALKASKTEADGKECVLAFAEVLQTYERQQEIRSHSIESVLEGVISKSGDLNAKESGKSWRDHINRLEDGRRNPTATVDYLQEMVVACDTKFPPPQAVGLGR